MEASWAQPGGLEAQEEGEDGGAQAMQLEAAPMSSAASMLVRPAAVDRSDMMGGTTAGPSHAEMLFEHEVKGRDKVDGLNADRQDPRVRTRVISDQELAEMVEKGTVPQAVKSSLKKRTEKGGLLGKAGLRGVESEGMPDALVGFAMATHTAPVVIPVGMMLYGTGSKVQEKPIPSWMGGPANPEPLRLPDAAPATGNLSLYRCTCCDRYLTKAEFATECTFHPGNYVNMGHCRWMYKCCNAIDPKHPGCRTKTTHTEDLKFSEVIRSMGMEIPPLQLHDEAQKLRQRFPGAYADSYLAVEVRVRGGKESINLQVLAPPQPSIAAVKTLLHAQDKRFVPGKTELVTALGGEILMDDSALISAKGLQANGVATTGGCTRALVLYTVQEAAQMEEGGAPDGESEAARDLAKEKQGWKKVPIRRGDSLQKLSLKYDRTVAAIKAANNIVGNEVEAWRDDLWLPPAAVEGQKLKRPIDNPVKEFFFILKGEGDGAMPHPKMCGMQAALPSHAEVETYLALSDGDVQAAVDAWADDMDCARNLLSLLRNLRLGCADWVGACAGAEDNEQPPSALDPLIAGGARGPVSNPMATVGALIGGDAADAQVATVVATRTANPMNEAKVVRVLEPEKGGVVENPMTAMAAELAADEA